MGRGHSWQGKRRPVDTMPKGKKDSPQAQARRRGRLFEAVIDKEHKAYAHFGIADIHKIPTPCEVISAPYQAARGKFQVFEAKWGKREFVDFEGVIKGGRAIRVEAKLVSKDVISRNKITGHQKAHLERTIRLGGIAGILCALTSGVWYVPAEIWMDPSSAGITRVTYRAQELNKIGVALGGPEAFTRIIAELPNGRLDYLSAAHRAGFL